MWHRIASSSGSLRHGRTRRRRVQLFKIGMTCHNECLLFKSHLDFYPRICLKRSGTSDTITKYVPFQRYARLTGRDYEGQALCKGRLFLILYVSQALTVDSSSYRFHDAYFFLCAVSVEYFRFQVQFSGNFIRFGIIRGATWFTVCHGSPL